MRGWRRKLGIAAAAGLLAVASAFLSLTCRPAWFRPAGIDYATLEQDKQGLVHLLDQVGAGLNRGQAAEIVLDGRQLNRWIAARRELPADLAPADLSPLQELQVEFLSSRELRVAGLVERGGFGVVAAVTLEFDFEADRVVVHWKSASAGRLPILRSWLGRALGDGLRGQPEARELLGSGQVAIPNDFVWPNGKRRFWIERVEPHPAGVRAVLRPL